MTNQRPTIFIEIDHRDRRWRVSLPRVGTLRIGRAAEAEIRLAEDASVSRLHAELRISSVIEVVDCGGKNGTRITSPGDPGGKVTDETAPQLLRTLAVGESHQLRGNEEIHIGAAILRLGSPRQDAQRDPEETPPTLVDPKSLAVDQQIARLAPMRMSVLLVGESGVGKDVFARRLHRLSPRRSREFVALNCGALVEALTESELFGHERGAFTGAVQARTGLLEAASGGTMFLDEIGELPLGLQVKLLRALEAQRVTPVGAQTARPIDVRFVAATNRDLQADVRAGRFRRDLYFRVAAAVVEIPPLRDRPADIAPLAATLLAQLSASAGREACSLAPEVLQLLEAYRWPGNIRELRNVLERAMAYARGGEVRAEHIVLDALLEAPADTPASPPEAGEDERTRILAALEECAGNQTRASARLGITRRMLVRRLEKYAIPRPRS